MNEVWNLDRMYAGFDDPKYQADFDRFQKKVAEFIAIGPGVDSAIATMSNISSSETHFLFSTASFCISGIMA